MGTHWILIHLPSPKLEIRRIGLHSKIASSLRPPNFFTRSVKCRVQISRSWWNYGPHIQHCEIPKMCPLWTFHHSQSTGTCTVRLMQYPSVVCHGKASLFHLTVPSPRIPRHGWKLDTKYGLENLAYFSRWCWRTPTFKIPSITHHIGNMIHITNVVTRILCQVTGHGNTL